MNKRIKLLAEQAMVTVPAAEGSISHTYFDKEKFAELIVRECARDFDKTYMSGGKTMGDYIRQKFGVD